MYCKKLVNFALIICICLAAASSTLLADPIDSNNIDGPVTGNLFINNDWDNPSSITDYEFVNFLPGAETSGFIQVNAGGEVHLYGGTFNSEFGPAFEGWFELTAVGGVITVHGTKFWVGGQLNNDEELIDVEIDPNIVPYIDINPATTSFTAGAYGYYNIIWEHPDGTIYDIWMDATVPINLSTEGAREINVFPADLTHDYGDIEIGVSETYVVQIVNSGCVDLTVSDISLEGSADFAITAEPVPTDGVIVIAPDEIASTDIEITFTPSSEAFVQATLTIASDDTDEPTVEVVLSGVGVVIEVPVEKLIQLAIDLFNESIADGTIIGYAPKNNAKTAANRIKALGNMLEAAGKLYTIGETDIALKQLQSIAKKTDGEKKPPDFVIGDSVAELNLLIDEIIEILSL
ncbi:MAG: choice-of-anchor D domain-containing protein [Planctomycetes bacterium]|nr:choice-of-anchor D domain-containing protein [Planctomycetota bacterium]